MRSSSLARRMVRGVLLLFVPPTVVAAGVFALLYSLRVHQHPAALGASLAVGGGALMTYLAFMIHGMADSLAATLCEIRLGVELMGTAGPAHRLAIRTGDEMESLADAINTLADRLAARREALAAILEGLPDAVAAVTAEGRVAFANAAAQFLLDPHGEPLVGRDLVDVLQPADAPLLADMLRPGAGARAIRLRTCGGGLADVAAAPVPAPRHGHPAFILTLRPTQETLEPPSGDPACDHALGRPQSRPAARPVPPRGDGLDRNRPLAETDCIVLDVETTGLDRDGDDRIVALAAVRVRRGAVRTGDVFESLVNPGRAIPPASVAIHGITAAMTADAPPIDTVLPDFHRFAHGGVLAGHDVWFDLHFLSREARRIGLPPIDATHPVLDTALLARLVDGRLADLGLDGLASRLGVPVLGRHTALPDAITTAEIYVRLVGLLAGRGVVTLGDVVDACARLRQAAHP